MNRNEFATFVWDEIHMYSQKVKGDKEALVKWKGNMDAWYRGRIAANTVSFEHFVRVARAYRLRNPYRQSRIDERKSLKQADTVSV